MSLQSIMDATPTISWKEGKFGNYIGSSATYSYSVSEINGSYELRWYTYLWEEPQRKFRLLESEVIDKINELEGIK